MAGPNKQQTPISSSLPTILLMVPVQPLQQPLQPTQQLVVAKSSKVMVSWTLISTVCIKAEDGRGVDINIAVWEKEVDKVGEVGKMGKMGEVGKGRDCDMGVGSGNMGSWGAKGYSYNGHQSGFNAESNSVDGLMS